MFLSELEMFKYCSLLHTCLVYFSVGRVFIPKEKKKRWLSQQWYNHLKDVMVESYYWTALMGEDCI